MSGQTGQASAQCYKPAVLLTTGWCAS
jgi:hypothetical protein